MDNVTDKNTVVMEKTRIVAKVKEKIMFIDKIKKGFSKIFGFI
ncbi:MAG: hypothetical protein ACTHL3_03360 [Candidatus Nitrosocosmicus sp.]